MSLLIFVIILLNFMSISEELNGPNQIQGNLLQRSTQNSPYTPKKSFNDNLCEYIYLELGTSKKEIFNYVHLGQSIKFKNGITSMKLLNTIAHSKKINYDLEADLCLKLFETDRSNSKILPEFNDNDDTISIDSLVFVSSQLEECNFKAQFFVSRSSFYIINAHLMKEYASTAYKRTDLDVEKHLLIALTYLGTVQSYKEIGAKFNIAISTAHKCVNDVANILFKHMGELIYWPVDNQADLEIQEFSKLLNNKFPGILGVIGTVDLKKTCTSNPTKYTKEGSSIAIQCVCNSKYQFYNVFTSYLLKSSVTTSTFLESPLAEIILNEPDTLFRSNDTHIIGSSCFPLLPNLMTPFFEDIIENPYQNKYNEIISVPLNTINLAFGKLLGRFKRLLCLDLWGQEKFAVLIFAACCIHNICMGNEDDIDCEAYNCCSFKCEYYDEYSVQKRNDIVNKLN
ncbi:uncharacterized protein LOC126905975 isoform X2 [Daktulosphaira vitifoliae]|uniref:uncharacterized protein LOC126905975 isoform X2 n=1 Tax=Daktulosphaira vitifoliae TaxID=58002 RepID=UPI0021AAC3AF|nr:uncharacterized protein LOC126905975 isoform X2 [Daktulosphaira vitifoliae]